MHWTQWNISHANFRHVIAICWQLMQNMILLVVEWFSCKHDCTQDKEKNSCHKKLPFQLMPDPHLTSNEWPMMDRQTLVHPPRLLLLVHHQSWPQQDHVITFKHQDFILFCFRLSNLLLSTPKLFGHVTHILDCSSDFDSSHEHVVTNRAFQWQALVGSNLIPGRCHSCGTQIPANHATITLILQTSRMNQLTRECDRGESGGFAASTTMCSLASGLFLCFCLFHKMCFECAIGSWPRLLAS